MAWIASQQDVKASSGHGALKEHDASEKPTRAQPATLGQASVPARNKIRQTLDVLGEKIDKTACRQVGIRYLKTW